MKLIIDIHEKVYKNAREDMLFCSGLIANAIKNGTPIEQEPKMGKWKYIKKEDSYKCSLCGFPCHKDNLGAIPTEYCAGCGAKMSEVIQNDKRTSKS